MMARARSRQAKPVTLDHVDQLRRRRRGEPGGTLTYAALSRRRRHGFAHRRVGEGAVCTAMLSLYQNEGII